MAINAAAATSVHCSAVNLASQSGRREFEGCASNLAFVRFSGGWARAKSLKIFGTSESQVEGSRMQSMQVVASVGKTEESEIEKKTDDYTDIMQQTMGTVLTYRHELGMNYAHVLPNLIVGSCLQAPADVDKLKKAGIGTIFCLQQDPDLAYFSVDINAIIKRAEEVDGIEHIRAQIRDFDPYDLRLRLPQVVATLYQATKRNGGTAYVHCTAGLGRAPAVALTYMYWILGYDLFEANAMLQKVRHCHPKLDSIKAATADLLTEKSKEKVKLGWLRGATQSVEVAGIDVGWYELRFSTMPIRGQEVTATGLLAFIIQHSKVIIQRVAFTKNPDDGHWYLERELPVGKYEFKYIVDGNWCTNPDSPSTLPNKDGHVNNFIEVKGDKESWEFRQQIMAEDFVLTNEHRKTIKAKLEELAKNK